MEESDDEYYFFIDQIHILENEDVLKALLCFMEYLPDNCSMLLGSHIMWPEAWNSLWIRGKVSFLNAFDLIFDKRELRTYFQMSDLRLSDKQLIKAYQQTNGWPGLLSLIGTANQLDELSVNKLKAIFNSFIEKTLWSKLSDLEKQILQYGNLFPFFDEELLSEATDITVEEQDLRGLILNGLIPNNDEDGFYRVSDIVKNSIEYNSNYKIIYSKGLVKEKAAIWYEKQGYIKEMFQMIESEAMMSDALVKHVKSIPGKIPVSDLSNYLNVCEDKNNCGELFFLSGYVSAKYFNEKLLDEKEQRLYDLWMVNQDNWHLLEYYLNLLYHDYRIDMCDWLQQVGKLWTFSHKLHIYNYANGCPLMFNNVKNYADMFICSTSEKHRLYQIWTDCLDEEAQLVLKITEYNYCIETQRYNKLFNEMRNLYDRVLMSDNGELLAGVFYLLVYLQNRKAEYDFMDEIRALKQKLKKSNYVYVKMNCDVMEIVSSSIGKEDERILWLLYNAPEENAKNICDNAYMLLTKARCYFKLQKFQKAQNLFKRLEEYYGRQNNSRFYAECLFSQAALYYLSKNRKEAASYATKGLIVGIKYRFIDLYAYYGEAGTILIENYQKMTGVKKPSKKQYYYGNILRADHATFQEILLRAVKKGQWVVEQVKQDVDMSINQLTLTEKAVLSYIEQGYANQLIADTMNIKLSTVKNHTTNIYRKLGVSTRVQAVNEAKRKGLLQ